MGTYQRGAPSVFATWIGIALVGLFLFIGLLNNASELILLSIMVLAFVALLRGWAALSTLKMDCALDCNGTRVFAGECSTITVTAQNRKLLPVCLDVHLPVDPALHSADGKRYMQAGTTMSSYQQTDFEWQIKTTKRGVFTAGPLRIASADLLGFFFRDHHMQEEGLEIVVYPRLVPLAALNLPKRDFFGVPGGESPVDDPVYILGTADYHPGNPARFIHWKASARHHRLQQKVFEPTEQEKVMIVLDVEGYKREQAHQAFESTLEVVASLAVRLDEHGCALGFLTNGVMNGTPPMMPITRNPAQIVSMLEALARVTMDCRQSIAEMMLSLQMGWGATCIYFCRDRSPEADLAKARFLRKRMPVVFMPFEKTERLRREGTPCKKTDEGDGHVIADGARP